MLYSVYGLGLTYHVDSETIFDYKQLLQTLLELGYTILAITIDGKRGLYKASQDLQKIMYSLTKITEDRFTSKLNEWYLKHKDFLDEKSISSVTGKTQYTHPRVRSAYKSLMTNLPYLFTYKNYKNILIHNTTNSIDGGVFSPIKKLLKVHNGFTKSLKINMVDDYLVNFNVK